MSKKQSRLQQQIKEIISNYAVQNVPSEYGIVSITKVELSKDGSKAKVYFTVIPEENEEKVKEFLKKSKRELISHIKNLRIKTIPELEFEVDKELKIMEKFWERNE